jgi:class 3 adenylate cyclase
MEGGRIVIHRGEGAVLSSDASGFTTLTDRLAHKSNGAELLSQCLTAFFGELLAIISDYRGDVIKFSGDSLTVYFPDFDDTGCNAYKRTRGEIPPHGSYGHPDLGPMATAVLRASACCVEVHKRFHNYDTRVDGVKLCLHIGVGCGRVHILQVGGQKPPESRHLKNEHSRCEYIIVGQTLEQISKAEKLAKTGQTCLSPEAWHYVKDFAVEGPTIHENPSFHLLEGLGDTYTFPTIKHAAKMFDCRREHHFRRKELPVIRRFIPYTVFQQIECDTLAYVNEMRKVSTCFVKVAVADLMTDEGAKQAQELTSLVQKCCYQHEGTFNKLLMDEKGLKFLLVFGLPPLVHTDDPTRAVLACFDMAKEFEAEFGRLEAKFGITTGRTYCGLYGSTSRKEYTVVGDRVNLANRLMSHATPGMILCDEETKEHATTEVIWYALAAINVKGKDEPVNIFFPEKKPQAEHIGLCENVIHFPWYDNPFGGISLSANCDRSTFRTNMLQLCSVKTWDGIRQVQKLLGGQFNKAMYLNGTPTGSSKAQPSLKGMKSTLSMIGPPEDSPFLTGGVVVIAGDTGTGKIELAEHIVAHTWMRFPMMPVFATMGPRPCGGNRAVSELLRSILGVYRHLDPSVPLDDAEALAQVIPESEAHNLPKLKQAVCENSSSDRPDFSEAEINSACELLSALADQTSILIVMQFEHGTSRFPWALRQDLDNFWNMVTRLNRLVTAHKDGAAEGKEPICMLLLVKDVLTDNPAVQDAQLNLHLVGLDQESLAQYVSIYLGVPPEAVDPELEKLVSRVSQGNPLYIRETISELQRKHLVFKEGPNKQISKVECIDGDKIDIASWQHTAMVSGTVCQLEGLDPREAAVVKNGVCFKGTFTLTDLAARMCSRWAGSTRLDQLLLFSKMRGLEKRNFIERVTEARPTWASESAWPSSQSSSQPEASQRVSVFSSPGCAGARRTAPRFRMTSKLISSVGGSMVLQAQKNAVKRQALIDRVLKERRAAQMQDIGASKTEAHIPWYYEQAFIRMGAIQTQAEMEAGWRPTTDESGELDQRQQGCCSM